MINDTHPELASPSPDVCQAFSSQETIPSSCTITQSLAAKIELNYNHELIVEHNGEHGDICMRRMHGIPANSRLANARCRQSTKANRRNGRMHKYTN